MTTRQESNIKLKVRNHLGCRTKIVTPIVTGKIQSHTGGLMKEDLVIDVGDGSDSTQYQWL